MYDYFLGGFHNFEVDRKAADEAIAIWPDLPLVMRANRAFVRRAVRFLVAEGVDQFLDIGSGIPTVGNVHEVAQKANPAARVVYVDNDPIAVADSRALLRDNPRATIIHADARQPESILADPEVSHLLDLRRPVGVLIVALLHFVTDDEEAYRIVRTMREALVAGSYLAITHASDEGLSPETQAGLIRIYRGTPTPGNLRSSAAIARFFEGFELVEPGLVYFARWRPEGPDDLFVDEPERCPTPP
jgi:SAM-dependent methyltransferase